jgi:short-subunit dehydrogenase
MKILLTGGHSGLGLSLRQLLFQHNIVAPDRTQLDLCDYKNVIEFVDQQYDMLINCAGTGIGGKIDFVNHCPEDIQYIMQVNLLSPMLLSQAVLKHNSQAKIVNITSTNNVRYWPNDLAYSLSKKSLEQFGSMLSVEYPSIQYLEIRLGLTKTNFNQNRYKKEPNRYVDLYQNTHLSADLVSSKICSVLFDDTVKFIEISP